MSENAKNLMRVIKGKSVSNGIAMGPVVYWRTGILVTEKKSNDVKTELDRFNKTKEILLLQMDKIINSCDKKVSEIIKARKMILEDKSLIEAINSKISVGYVCEYAVSNVCDAKAHEFEVMENDYLRARSVDLIDIKNKMLNILCESNDRKMPDTPSIVFADEITPEEITSADKDKILAFVTKKGTISSHASIVAANINMPYIFGIDLNESDIVNIKNAIVDFDSFIINPDDKTIEDSKRKLINLEKQKNTLCTSEEEMDDKLSALGVKIYANISEPNDVDAALSNGASGIGLYRTEFLYIKSSVLPSEEEQFIAYKTVASKMNGMEVIIRTMDIGADKNARCIELPHEENPALGKRAIRICLEDTKLFRTQIRALLRASVYGNIKIMFPMIACEKEIDDIKEQVRIAEKELIERKEKYKIPPLGIMIETPAAAILSDKFAKKVDFFSVGTNDLTQYTLAVDRTGKNLERYYRADDPAVYELIKNVVRSAKSANIPVGICGEIAGDVSNVKKLMELGVREFSMAPSKIISVKNTIYNFENNDCIENSLSSPADGELVFMEKIPDKAFSSGELGRCIGINPENGNVYSPCEGLVTTIAKTGHAIGIQMNDGREILIHAGIDTVELSGKGFYVKVKEGMKVKNGDLLLTFDIDTVKNAGFSPMVILVITKE